MRGVLLGVIAVSLAGCGQPPNRLYGSAGDIYSLDFDSVQVNVVAGSLVAQYLRSTNARTLKMTVNLAGLAVTPGQDIDLTEVVSGSPRATLQRIVDQTTELPLETGTLTLSAEPAAGAHLVGHFATLLANPEGRTLNGDFDVQVAP